MKILSTILAHDKRIDTLQEVIDSFNNFSYKTDLIGFCFDTEIKTIQMFKDNNIKVCSYKRPEVDKSKITCSYILINTGMREAELMHLSWLRNQALEKCVAGNYDYIFFIDSDVVIPENGLERLLKLESDIASGWYFHKRLPSSGISWKYKNLEEYDHEFINKNIVNGVSAGNGCILYKRKVADKIKYDYYHGTEAEDGTYQKKAVKMGFSFRVDLGLYCEHIGDDFKPKASKYKEEKSKLWRI